MSEEQQEQSGKPQSEDSVVEVLIGLIQNKRPLWDHRLPIVERGKSEKDKLWTEIWKEMGCTLPMDTLQKKWKNLRDQFMKTRAQVESYVPSGHDAEISSKKKIWKHYESLKFLHDTVQPRQTSSNLQINLSMPNSPSTSNVSDESCGNFLDITSPIPTPGKKRKRKQETFEETLIQVLEKPIVVPPPTPAPQLSPTMLMVSSLLDKLPMKVRMQAERDIINKLYDLVEEHLE